MYAKVIVDISASAVDKVFDYLCPFDVQIGNEVLVPFGGRKISGIIIELNSSTDVSEDKLKPIIKILDGGITATAVETAKFISSK